MGRRGIALMVLLLTTLSTAARGQKVEKVTFGTPMRLNASYVLPPLTAMERGFWKELGLDAEWVAFDSSVSMQRAVAAGSISAGTGAVETVLTGNARDIPEVIVADNKTRTYFYFWVMADSRLKSPQDLKQGARLGLSRFGTTIHFYSDITLKNLEVKKMVKVVAIGGGTSAVAALRAGRVDVLTFSPFTVMPLIANGEVRALLRVDDYLPEGLGLHETVLAYRPFMEKNQEALRKLVTGYFKAARFVMDNPDWTMAKMKEAVRYSETAAQKALPMIKYSRDGKIEPAVLEKIIVANRDLLILNKVIAADSVPPVKRLYTCGFVGGC